MNLRKSLTTGLLAGTIALSGVAAYAQESTPASSPGASPSAFEGTWTMAPVLIMNKDKQSIGTVELSQDADGVHIHMYSKSDSGLAPGDHGVHIHQYGVCDGTTATPFESAGPHFDSDEHHHGAPGDEMSHDGDLGNFTVNDDGTFDFTITTTRVTLQPNMPNSLSTATGSALVIHEDPDDLKTDPSGNSGARLGCGVLFTSLAGGAPVSTPAASPAATPAG